MRRRKNTSQLSKGKAPNFGSSCLEIVCRAHVQITCPGLILYFVKSLLLVFKALVVAWSSTRSPLLLSRWAQRSVRLIRTLLGLSHSSRLVQLGSNQSGQYSVALSIRSACEIGEAVL